MTSDKICDAGTTPPRTFFRPNQDKVRYSVRFKGNPAYRNKGRSIHTSIDAYSREHLLTIVLSERQGWWNDVFTVEGDRFFLYAKGLCGDSDSVLIYIVTAALGGFIVEEIEPNVCRAFDALPPRRAPLPDAVQSADDFCPGSLLGLYMVGRYVCTPSEPGWDKCSAHEYTEGMMRRPRYKNK